MSEKAVIISAMSNDEQNDTIRKKYKCLFCKDRVKMLSLYFNPIKFNVNYTQNKKCSSFEKLNH